MADAVSLEPLSTSPRSEAPHACVTVLITCHNEEGFIAQTIESVLRQTAIDRVARIIVVDDGSKDRSVALLQEIAKREPLLEVAPIENRGPSGARNEGLTRVETRWVAVLDGDDLWAEDKLERQLAVADRAPESVAVVYGDVNEFTDEPASGTRIKVRQFDAGMSDVLERYFLFDGPIIPSTTLLRADLVREVGGFDVSMRLFEETDLYLRLAQQGYRFQYEPRSVTHKRKRATSASAAIDKWDHAMIESTRVWAAREARLAPLARRRLGYRYGKIADAYFALGEREKGWRFLTKALAHNASNPRAYGYALLGVLPAAWREGAKRAAQAARATVLQR